MRANLMMKRLLIAAAMILVVSADASAQSRRVDSTAWSRVRFGQPPGFGSIVEQVRSLDSLTWRVGWALAPGEFYKLSQEGLRSGTPDDFRRLLRDPTPLVRLMALLCLASSIDDTELAAAAALMHADTTVVTYANGCLLEERSTVGQLSRWIAERRFSLRRESARAR